MRHLRYAWRPANLAGIALYAFIGFISIEKSRFLVTVDVNNLSVMRVQERVGRGKGSSPLLLVACFLAPCKSVELLAWGTRVFPIGRTIEANPSSDG